MCKLLAFWVGILGFVTASAHATAIFVDLGTADSFAILAGSAVTNTGPTTIHGNVGVAPGIAVTGFPPGTVTAGAIHASDAVAFQAQRDLTTAYNFAASEASDFNLTGTDLAGLTLKPGVYTFASSAQLSGTLTLDGQGNPNAVFVFQIGTTFTTGSGASVVSINGGTGDSVFFQVGSSATLGINTVFEGNILALTDITVSSGTSIGCGRALALNGAVTLDTNTVSIDTANCETTTGTSVTAVPEPISFASFAGGLFGLVWAKRRSGKPRVIVSVQRACDPEPDTVPEIPPA